MHGILILYYSVNGSTEALARAISRGVDSVPGAEPWLRTVPPITAKTEDPIPAVPDAGPPYATHDELAACSGLLVGSPTRFGNMASAMKYFLDGTSGIWLTGGLAGKPAGVFTSSTSMHGGQETTLMTMAVPLLHHGMLLCGIPYTEPALAATQSGGTPYGASHVAGTRNAGVLTDEEQTLAESLGARVAATAIRLAG
ncbi:MAG: NAD(P)H:quinone oxidoreductase [Pseudomonadota bacterium]